MKIGIGPLAVLAGGFALGLGGMVGTGIAVSGGQGQVVVASSTGATHFDLTIATSDMLSNPNDMPAFLPSNLTLPANTDVTMTIKNFDDATPLASSSETYAKVTGALGNKVTISTLDGMNPNAVPTDSKVVGAIDPNDVAHTFTIPSLGLNIPLPAMSTVSFSFHTGAKGTYTWRCMDPCGTATSGWGGAMANDGWMQGKVHLV